MVHFAIHGYLKFMLRYTGKIYKVMMSPLHVMRDFINIRLFFCFFFAFCIKDNQQSLRIAMRHMYNMLKKKEKKR